MMMQHSAHAPPLAIYRMDFFRQPPYSTTELLYACVTAGFAMDSRAMEIRTSDECSVHTCGTRRWRGWREAILSVASSMATRHVEGYTEILAGSAPVVAFMELGRCIRHAPFIACMKQSGTLWSVFDLSNESVGAHAPILDLTCQTIAHDECDTRTPAVLLFVTTKPTYSVGVHHLERIHTLLPTLRIAHNWRLASSTRAVVVPMGSREAPNIGDLRMDIVDAYVRIREELPHVRHVIMACSGSQPLAFALGQSLSAELPYHQVHVVDLAKGQYELCW